MAVSRVDLANLALGHLYRDSIRDLDGSDPSAVQMKRFMDFSIRKVISEYDWPECRVVKALTVADVDSRGWTYAYTVPSDKVRVWRVSDLRGTVLEEFEMGMSADLESDTTYIYSDSAGLAIRYGSERVSLSRFTPDVLELIALDLAEKACMALAKDKTLKKYLAERYKAELSKAKTEAANLEPELHDLEFIPETIAVRSE